MLNPQIETVVKEPTQTSPKRSSGSITIQRGSNGQLTVIHGETSVTVRVCRCFPWTQSNRYISLRDDKDHEVALIKDLHELDVKTREVLEQALIEAGFVMEIISIESLLEVFEIRNWKVQTVQGARTFQTEMDVWPRTLPNGGFLIKDVAGDLFYIAEPGALNEKSQKLLWALVG